ncbi:MAG: adenylate/guanylate cyclase domain-containing protein [Candidatus Limnocylindria bacterium]
MKRRYFDPEEESPVICGSCGSQNDVGRKFCVECGAPLAFACANCGTPNPAGGKFCGECGIPLGASGTEPTAAATSASGADTAKAAQVAERRLVSVLFADLVGFTTISESRDAEDVRELLEGYFAVCRETIGRYGGTIEKFIGDAVMAVWGTPIAQEDDPERAVRTALDLVDAVRRMGEAAGMPDMALRAGVLTGEAAVTLGASDMGMVAGDLVNTASRLQSAAQPGTVLVGDSTRRASADAIAYEAVADQVLKGKELPVAAWRALRVVAKRGGAGRSDQLEAPFVGRSAELQLIKDFYHGTARERGVRLVSVIGQGGIGKSRLAWEFMKYMDGVTELAYWHLGRSPSYGDGITFWALGEMVRMRLGIGEGADEDATREALTASLAEFVPDEDERRTLEGPLLQLVGFDDGSGAERGELFPAWRLYFERISEQAPVVLVFEDLQWADEGLIDFIEDLLAWSRGKPIYVITLARPELLDRRPTWGAGQRGFTSLGLEPLTDAEMLELLGGLVPGLPEPAARTIVDRAEGIPLYAVETVRMLLNDGRLQLTDGRYQPVGDLSTLAVPETLHALIAARLDGLEPAGRGLLQDASVIGLSFSSDALAAVSGLPADDVERRLRHLVRRELIALDDDPRSPERGQYRFLQGLIKEVAYGTLAKRDRRARHLAAARHFEMFDDDEMAGVLAQHYVEAYRAQPVGEEGAAVAAQARVALRGAAARARALASPAHALTYVELALEVTTDPADELVLRREAGGFAADAGKVEASFPHLERAIDLATQLGDNVARRQAVGHLGNILIEGHQERALELLTDAMAEPGLTSDDDGYVEIAESLAKLTMRRSRFDVAVAIAEQALPAAEARGLIRLTVELLITRAVAISNIGRSIESVSVLTGIIALAERLNLHDAQLRAMINLGYVLDPDDPALAYRISRDGVEKARHWGQRMGLRYLLGNASDTAISVGDWDWALGQARDPIWDDSEPAERIWLGSIEAEILAARGEPVAELTAELERIAAGFDDAQYRGQAESVVWTALMASGGYREVVDRGRASLAWAGQAAIDSAPPIVSRAALRLRDADAIREVQAAFAGARKGRVTSARSAAIDGALAALEGRRADARAHYLESLRLLREMNLPWLVAITGLDAIVADALEPSERHRVAEEARTIFERLGAQPYLAQLVAALAGAPADAPPPGRSVPATDEVRSA